MGYASYLQKKGPTFHVDVLVRCSHQLVRDLLTVIMGKQGAEKGERINVTNKRRKSRQQKAKGARKGKRTTFTHEHRKYVCGLKKAGSKLSDISVAFAQRYGFQPHSSSLATLYNDKGGLNKNSRIVMMYVMTVKLE